MREFRAVAFAACLIAAAFPCTGAVVGEVAYSGGALAPASLLEAGSRLRPGAYFTDSLLAAELARVDSLLFARGLLAASITVDTLRAGDAIDVAVEVTEGERTAVGEVSFGGSSIFDADELSRRLGVKSGDWFDPPALGAGMRDLLAAYNDAGFPYAQVWLTGFAYRAESNRVELSVSIVEGDRAVISRILFDGLTKTDTTLAVRTSRLREGAVYNERTVQRSTAYLRLSGLFEAVGEAGVRRVSGGAVDVVIPVTERARSNRFQGAFGVSRDDEGTYVLSGSAEVELRNVAGSGRDVDFSWMNDGKRYSEVDVRYREPFIFSTPVHLDAEVHQIVQDTIYTWHSGGLYLTVPIAPDLSLVVGAAGDRNVPGGGELVRSVRQRYRVGVERRGEGPIRAAAHVEGAYKRNYLEGGLAESEGQILYRFEGSAGIGTFGDQTVYCRLVSEAVFSSHAIPAAERFPLGGAKTLRGYRENQFRGERIAFTNIEYRFGAEGGLFFFDDVGGYYTGEEGWTVKNGAGFGLRSASAVGVIELSFGVGDRLSLEGTRIHISLQESF